MASVGKGPSGEEEAVSSLCLLGLFRCLLHRLAHLQPLMGTCASCVCVLISVSVPVSLT